MGYNTKLVVVLKKLTQLLIDDRLDMLISLKIPIDRLLDENFEFTKEEYEKYLNKSNFNVYAD